jgi:hypothetical protein
MRYESAEMSRVVRCYVPIVTWSVSNFLIGHSLLIVELLSLVDENHYVLLRFAAFLSRSELVIGTLTYQWRM